MSEIQRLPHMVNTNPVHPNAKSTTQITNGTTTTKSNITSPVCRNCKTQTTPLWRRDETGQVLCNACGLFLKLHGRPRPISLKTDTIKSRNRIKQPNFSKKNGANTPELKSKDSRPPQNGENSASSVASASSVGNGKKSPKTGRKRSPPPDFTVQPQHQPQQHQAQAGQTSHHQNHQHQGPMHHLPGFATVPPTSSTLPSPLAHARVPSSHGPMHHHLHHFSGISSQVQSLHYPSSTPTQFAPGLQRITSPLLLSTTLSNARSVSSTGAASPKGSLSAAQAAGALENMSNVLGPSATFKGARPESANGVSLMGSSAKTPSSALKSESRGLPGIAPTSGASTGASSNVIASPSFGPQFHLDSPKRDLGAGVPKNSLPPLQQSISGTSIAQVNVHPGSSGPLPSIHHLHPVKSEERNGLSAENGKIISHSTEGQSQGSQAPPAGNQQSGSESTSSGNAYQAPSGQESNAQRQGGNGDDGDKKPSGNNNFDNNGHKVSSSGSADGAAYENTLLKTRISELELVNDLYRTRIMELEAMEQAARLRESSMRRRLDEVIALQNQNAARQSNSVGVEENKPKRED